MRRPTGRDEGQAAVELALVLPLVGLLLLALVQVGLLVRDQVMLVHAAREGARAAAVHPQPASARYAARDAATSSAGVPARVLDVEVHHHGAGPDAEVTVTVRYAAPTDVPLVGALLGDVALQASATMRVEPPP